MDRPFARLGTIPPSYDPEESAPVADDGADSPLLLALSVALDRPFHEIKQHLLEEFERAYLTRCLEGASMNLSKASRCSGLSRKHLRTLMAKYGMAMRRTLIVEEG